MERSMMQPEEDLTKRIERGGEPDSEAITEHTPEEEKGYTSKIELHFVRHGDKMKALEEQPDTEVELTEKGRAQSIEQSQTMGAKNIDQSVAFGSPRKRAQQTAGFVMAGQIEQITGDESPDELKQKLNESLKGKGSKIGHDPLLDFQDNPNSKVFEETLTAYKEGKLLSYLVEKSDTRAKELGEKDAYTYTSAAANVAKLVQKYMKIAPRWNKLVQDEEKDYTDTLERYLGSHQGSLEPFLAKVVELTKGIPERDKLVKALNGTGFDFVEGFDVEIVNKGGETPRVRVRYKKEKDSEAIFDFDEEIDPEDLRSIAHPEQAQ